MTAGILAALSLAMPLAGPAVAHANVVKKTAQGAAGGLAALVLLGKLMEYRNAHYYQYAKPVGEIEKKYTPMGPRKVASQTIKAPDTTWKAHEVFYPADMAEGEKLPLVLMANGTGTAVSKYREVLKHLASWGFVAAGNEEDNSRSGEGVMATFHEVGKLAAEPANALHGRVDLADVGVAGHSQGGIAVFHVVTNFPEGRNFRAAYTASATSLFWGDDGPLGKEWGYDVSDLQTPIFMTAGTGDWDAGKTNDPKAKEGQGIAPLWSLKKTFETIPDTTPKVVARMTGKDHGDMLRGPDAYMTAWFMYTLKGDQEAKNVFFGENSELSHNKNYQDVMVSE